MAKFKKRPVIPIYAIALVWVIFTLVHPLYRVSDYVTVILLSAVVFIVAKGIFPTISYEMPDPQPQAVRRLRLRTFSLYLRNQITMSSSTQRAISVAQAAPRTPISGKPRLP